MPELPEVEISRQGIQPFCLNKKIVDIVVRDGRLRWPVDKTIGKIFAGQKITQLTRRGKYILLHSAPASLMIHLGMSGSLKIVNAKTQINKHDHLDIMLSNKKIIRYNDPRRFGSVICNQQGYSHPLLVNLGVEPLSEDFNADYLYAACRTKTIAIKALIMQSKIVVGVGNIYAQESLFLAGIHPAKASNKISKKPIEVLVEKIKQVLAKAIEAGGSSLKDFTAADGKPGYFQHAHQVYGRRDQPCYQCNQPLRQMVIAQRSSVYCGKCQK